MRHLIRAVVLTGLVAANAHAQQKIAVFIGPQARDGFIDMDAGIRDSIKDIQQECQQGTVFSIASASENAALTLIVLGRGTPVSGSVGYGSAAGGIAFGFVAPNAVPTITTSLRVGKYERVSSREGGNWRNAAKMIVEDLTAWLEANRQALPR